MQIRNAGGTRFGTAVVFAVLVDSSGYATSVQQKYQFYFVTETDVRFGGQTLHPGAYGGGFVENGRFVVMDIGGHTLAEGATLLDNALARPRPLQITAEHENSAHGDSAHRDAAHWEAVRLYLGRRYILIEAAAH